MNWRASHSGKIDIPKIGSKWSRDLKAKLLWSQGPHRASAGAARGRATNSKNRSFSSGILECQIFLGDLGGPWRLGGLSCWAIISRRLTLTD